MTLWVLAIAGRLRALVGAAEEARADQLALACVRVALGDEHPLEPRGRGEDGRLGQMTGHSHSIGNRGPGLKRVGPSLEVRLAPRIRGVSAL